MSLTPTRSYKQVLSISNSGAAKNARTVTVSPPPAVSQEHGSAVHQRESFPELEFLCQFLGISKEKDVASLDEFLCEVGCGTLDDLAFIGTENFKENQTLLSPVIRSKLVLLADFLNQGGTLEGVSSMKEVVTRVRAANSPKTAIANDGESSNDAVVVLDVGGCRFTTTKETLCRVPGSLLESMFSGRHENPAPRSQDGAYVLDRNGMHFHHILDFLRVGAVISLPPDDASKQVLAIEADYYGLEALVRAIRMPQVDTSEHLSEDVLSMRREEDTMRMAFASRTAGEFDKHRGLVPLFCPDNGIQPLPLKYEPIQDTSPVLMDNLRKKAQPGTPVTARSLEEFQSNFNREHPNVLHRLSDILLEEPVIIAGGAVLRALTSSSGVRTANWWGKKSDIDLFLHCSDPQEANRIARRIFFSLAVDHERWVVLRSHGVITMHNWIGEGWRARIDLKVQIVLRLYDSPAEVLMGFDCDSCCCAYDGRSVWLTPRCLRALRTGVNILNPLHAWPNKPSHELRLAKYAYRGFPVIVPGLDKKRVDYDLIRCTDLRKLKGLARLLKIAFEMDDSPESFRFPQAPSRVQKLRDHVRSGYNDAELLTGGLISGYYNTDIGSVIIPDVFCEGEPTNMMWYEFTGGHSHDFPLSRECRGPAWRQILYAGPNPPRGLPERLLDAWDNEKRSREYRNSEMDKFDLDNIYYCQAYKTDDA